MNKITALLSACLLFLLASVSFAQNSVQIKSKSFHADKQHQVSIEKAFLTKAVQNRGLTNDLAISSIEPQYAFVGKPYSPSVSIENTGAANQTTYEVNLSDGVSYDETISGTVELSQSQITSLSFPSWTPASADQTLLATVTLVGDEFADNDTMTFAQVIELSYDQGYSYGFDAYGENTNFFVRTHILTGETTPLMEKAGTDFIVCGDYFDNAIMAIDYANDVFYVNGDGMHYQIGHLETTSVTGLAHDVVNDVTYMVAVDGTASYLYSLDENFNATSIGYISSTLIIGIACDSNGDLYGVDMGTDNLVSIDKTTAEFTVVGALGIDLNYAQDIGFDRATNQLYGGLYSSFGGWYTIDVETGLANLIYNVNREMTMVAVVPGDWYLASFQVDDGVNPIQGASISINSTELLTDVDGHAETYLLGGSYPYAVSFEGYETYEGNVLVEDISVDVEVSLSLISSLEQNASNLNIYPNPTKDIFYVDADLPFEFEMYDLTGKLLLKDTNAQMQKEININAFSSGIYMLKIHSVDGAEYVHKLVKE